MFTGLTRAGGMRTFMMIWAGQFGSLLGTSMTRFALLIWIYQQTGAALTVALLGFFSFGAYVIASPLAGIWVDRLDRRKVMLYADLGAGLMTVALLLMYSSGQLETWHLYLAQAVTGALEAFQLPAYAASISTLLPKEHYTRANGLRSLAFYASEVLGPVLAGVLLVTVGLAGVMLVDVVTFLLAVGTLLLVRIPRPAPSGEGAEEAGGLARFTFGFRYILARPGLVGLLVVFFGIQLFGALTYFSILPAMVLARSGGDELALAAVQSVMGLAGVIGGIVMSIWGGFRRLIHNMLGMAALSFLLGDLLFALGRSTHVWVAAAFAAAVFIPFISGAYQALWQRKVAPDVQGRVFAARNIVQHITTPIGYISGGLLADYFFEPAMAAGGPLSGTFGWLVGTGPGAGMALMFVCTALLGCAISLVGYFSARIRNVEEELPDHSMT